MLVTGMLAMVVFLLGRLKDKQTMIVQNYQVGN